MHPDGIQRSDLAPDIADALAADPAAGAFFDSLAQFYRNAYIKWIDATKRRPDVRAERIAEMIQLLRSSHKQRPAPEDRPEAASGAAATTGRAPKRARR
jgi:uncharacterized protein YdeI (YjbR/CyaY-like superfamily)